MSGTSEADGVRAAEDRYWRRSVQLVLALLVVWFSVSFGCGIVLRDALDRFELPGTRFPLGFWFAQQGAILVFVVLIGVYVFLAGQLDRRLARELSEGARARSATGQGEQRS